MEANADGTQVLNTPKYPVEGQVWGAALSSLKCFSL